ncbi:MAG: FAD-binding protein, partial [Pseudomonadota bacterium]
MASYDVIVIGSGPGGYVAAIRCAQSFAALDTSGFQAKLGAADGG